MSRGLNPSTYCTGALSVALRAVVHPWYKRFPLCNHQIAIRPATVIIQRYFNMSTSDSGRAAAKPAAVGAGSDGVAPNSNIGLRERKMTLRKHIKAELKVMDTPAVEAASGAVARHLLKMPQLAQGVGEGGAVSVYLSMPGELGTSAIISELFKRGKKIYIPKVLGPGSADMRMFPLESEEEVQSFPLTKWKIPEPSKELVLSREDGVLAGDIDVVVVPGMAFDARCNRLGHGKGYYDCFFERIKSSNKEKGRPPPMTMGVCFDEQIVESVPTSSTDVPLDFVFTPSHVFRRDTDTGGC